MLKNKEHDFRVELADKTWKISSKDGSKPIKEITQPTIKVIFNRKVGYGYTTSFNSYYGSKPCYDEEYAGETEYEYEVDFDLLSEEIFDDQDYYADLADRNPNLFYAFYAFVDEDEEVWIWEPDERSAHDLIVDALVHKKGFADHIQERAQTNYDNNVDTW